MMRSNYALCLLLHRFGQKKTDQRMKCTIYLFILELAICTFRIFEQLVCRGQHFYFVIHFTLWVNYTLSQFINNCLLQLHFSSLA